MIFLLTLLGCPICFDEQPQERPVNDGIKQEPVYNPEDKRKAELFYNDDNNGMLSSDEYIAPSEAPPVWKNVR